MGKSDEKRAKIIAEQAAREAQSRAAGQLPNAPPPRTNWAATAPIRPRRGPKVPRPRS